MMKIIDKLLDMQYHVYMMHKGDLMFSNKSNL